MAMTSPLSTDSDGHTDSLLVAYAAAESSKGAVLAICAKAASEAGDYTHEASAWAAEQDAVPLRATLFASKYAHHPYGIATLGRGGNPQLKLCSGTVFVTNQGDGRILSLDASEHLLDPARNTALEAAPWPPPDECQECDGSGTTGVRGCALSGDGTMLFVACRDGNCLSVYSALDGAPDYRQLRWTLRDTLIQAPIALEWGTSGDDEGLFISGQAPPIAYPGLSESEREKIVFVSFWCAASRRVTRTFAHADAGGHAAGLARVGGALLVLGQEMGAVYQFAAHSGAFVGMVAEGLVRPEALCVWGGGWPE